MRRSWCVRLALVAVAAIPLRAGAQAAAGPFGVVLNVDGDISFSGETLDASRALLRAEVDRWADAGVETLVYSVGAGSEIMLYPTEVADTWGWRSTSYDDDPRWGDRIARNRRNQEAGGDGPMIAGRRAKERGLRFLPSLRMNDAHYVFGRPPEAYPLTGSFYLENRDLVIGESPIRSRPQYGELLDFSHPAVRDHRMAQIREILDRYQHVMDGFEMDFTRFQVFFPPGQAAERAHLITEMVRQTRRELDALGEAHGRDYALFVRVPPAPANCAWAGLEVERWIAAGLVDLVSPSQMMTMGFAMPIDAFRAMASGRVTAVYPTFLPRVGWRWSGPPTYGLLGPNDPGKPSRLLTTPQLRAAAWNMARLGGEGVYLFNYASAVGDTARLPIEELLPPAPAVALPMCFTVTKAYWQDHEDSYQYAKQLPAPLGGESPATRRFDLLVGAAPGDLTEAGAGFVLRLGWRSLGPGTTARIRVNEAVVFEGDLVASSAATLDGPDDAFASDVRRRTHLAEALLDLPIKADSFRRGVNAIEVTVTAEREDALQLTDLELHALPVQR